MGFSVSSFRGDLAAGRLGHKRATGRPADTARPLDKEHLTAAVARQPGLRKNVMVDDVQSRNNLGPPTIPSVVMTPSELSQCLETLRAAGLTNEDFARLHHSSEKGRKAYLSDAISYFRATMSLKRNNLDLAERCMYVGGQFALDRTDKEQILSEALAQWPLNQGGLQTPLPVAVTKSETRRGNERRATTRPPSKKLGDDGEELAVSLLASRGYTAELLSKNFPTYDIQASGESNDFLVSVKVARLHQHLRLGSRNSVSRLSDGNFIFAFLANPSNEVDLVPGGYRLLILPAAEVRDYALSVHDAYWAAKGKADRFSVMIKAYDPMHIDVWQRWTASYQDAWQQLPTPKA